MNFSFLMSILTNLKISGTLWMDFDYEVEGKFDNINKYIEIMSKNNGIIAREIWNFEFRKRKRIKEKVR